jgi:uncharacterized membrane protein YqiK
MMRIIALSVLLTFAATKLFAGAETAKGEADLKREAATAEAAAKMGTANAVEDTRPRLAANTNAGPEVPMKPDVIQSVPEPRSKVSETGQGRAERRRTGLTVLAVVAVVAGSYLLQRLRSRSDPS